MSGKASNSGVANLEANVLVHNPDVVFIEFAVNDAFIAYEPTNIDFGTSSAGWQSNLNSMIDSIVAQNPSCEIILQTMNPVWDAPNGNQSGSKRPDLAAYYQGYRDVAMARGLVLIDHYSVWTKLQANQLPVFQSYVADGVHPNGAGYSHLVTPATRHALGAENGLVLLIDPATGRAVLQNQSSETIHLIGYTISSHGGALKTTWDGFSNKEFPDWFVANPTSHNLSELNPTSELALLPRKAIDFDIVWNTGAALDLQLTYQTLQNAENTGMVIYTSLLLAVDASADFNNYGTIDGSDFLIWQRGFGLAGQTDNSNGNANGVGTVNAADLANWNDQFGTVSSPLIANVTSVPEPSSAVLMVYAALAGGILRKSM